MEERKWWKESVVYQIYPMSFYDANGDGIGDLRGIQEKLPYLKRLGVDVLWISPFYKSPGFDNGYDISDYEAVDGKYGSGEDLDRLIQKAREMRIKIVLDLVVKHASDQHTWFVESRKSREAQKRDWYIWRDAVQGKEPNNWGSLFGGPAWTLDEKTGQYYLHLFSPHQPDLNWRNEEVRRSVYEMMNRWIDRGIDGFRMDVISLIAKPSEYEDGPVGKNGYADWHPTVANNPKVHEYLREMRRRVLDRGDLMTVGEASAVTVEEAEKYACSDGSELNMVFQFEHVGLDGSEEFKWNDRRIPVSGLKQVMNKWQLELEGKAWNSLFWCNHDQPRIVSRLGDEGKYRERSAKMLATCLHMMKGTPYIFQGEELGMTNFPFSDRSELRDIESLDAYDRYVEQKLFTPQEMLRIISLKSRDNARTPMQWSAGENGGFTTGTPWMKVNPNHVTINAGEQMGREDSVWEYYRRLIALRHSRPCIVYGRFAPCEEGGDRIYAYTRENEEEKLLVVCNFTGEAQTFDVDAPFRERGELLLSNVPESGLLSEGELQPWEAAVISVRNQTA